jgi:hypothetical protein
MKTYGRSGGTAPRFLTWALHGGAFIFTPLPLYLRGYSARYSMYKRLGVLQSRSGPFGKLKNLLPLPGIESQLLGCPTRNLVSIPTELLTTQLASSAMTNL